MTEAKKLTKLVMKFLNSRGGFDDVLDSLDKQTRADFEEDLEELFANTIPEIPRPG